jgi:hypothetical protein
MFVVIENTPGYTPDSDDPFITDDYSAAVDYADKLADELEGQGYLCDRAWASSSNYYAIHCTRPDAVATDLGRYIAVEQTED